MRADAKQKATGITVTACAALFAVLFWLLDAGTALVVDHVGLLPAIVPQGSEFVSRIVYALAFGIGGAVTGAAVLRSRIVEEFARGRLSVSDHQYRALLAASFDGILTLDRIGRVVDASHSAAALFGRDPATLRGMPIAELIERDGGMTMLDLLRDDHAVGRKQAVRARGGRGQPIPAELRVTHMPGGLPEQYLLAIRETTADVVARKALRHSERRYQSLFDNIPDGVYRSRPDGRLLAANPALVRLLGYDSVDDFLANGNARDMYSDLDQRAALVRELDRNGMARNVEVVLKRRDGTTVPALANVRAVSSEGSDDIVFEGTLTDISDLVAAREALEDSEEHFRALCEHALDIINVVNADGEILYSSPSSRELTGRLPAEQVGLRVFRNAHPDDRDGATKSIEQGFAKPGSPQRFTCRVYRHDGTLRYLDAVGTAFMGRGGELRAVIHSRDVTDRVATEAQLREMQKIQVVGRLTDGLAHDFNNLLTVISGNLEMLDDRVVEPALRTHVDSALAACQQGCDLTRRLLAFADRQDAAAEYVNVNGLLMDMEGILHRSLSESIRIDADYAGSLWEVHVDPVQLEAAILQIAVNAKEAMHDTGTLTIRTANVPATESAVGDCVRIRIEDDGAGMTDEVLERATDPFFSTNPRSVHTGLGLTSVKRFVEAAGGRLEIRSEPGAGTCVSLDLPRVVTGEYAAVSEEALQGGSERILLVDDNADVRSATAALLGSLGYDVQQCGDGFDALNMLQTHSFDLLFTDLAMPRLSGLELASRASAERPELKILLTTGNEAASLEASNGLGPQYPLIRKPFRRQGLAAHVLEALES